MYLAGETIQHNLLTVVTELSVFDWVDISPVGPISERFKNN